MSPAVYGGAKNMEFCEDDMNDKELRALIERMIAEVAGQAPTPQVKGATTTPWSPRG